MTVLTDKLERELKAARRVERRAERSWLAASQEASRRYSLLKKAAADVVAIDLAIGTLHTAKRVRFGGRT